VDREWQETFRNRMRGFEARRAPQPGEAAVSIKVRVALGCFHREHSPRAYELRLAFRDLVLGLIYRYVSGSP
jgi:hypothetical protein